MNFTFFFFCISFAFFFLLKAGASAESLKFLGSSRTHFFLLIDRSTVLKLRLTHVAEDGEGDDEAEEHLQLDLVFNAEDAISQLGADVPLLDIRHSNDLLYILDQANTICENLCAFLVLLFFVKFLSLRHG